MKRAIFAMMISLVLQPLACLGAGAGPDAKEVLILCYHSVQAAPPEGAPYTISQARFAEQMDYLRTHGYRPVGLRDIIEARRGTKALPPKAVLLTFDDGYRSYAEFVVPLLKLYGFPSMLAVVGNWIENGPPAGLAEPLLEWSELKKLAGNPLVALASHSFDLHKAVQYTPQGNVGAVVGVRAYLSREKRYESESEYRRKLQDDFRKQEILFLEKLGRKPQAMVWPYGHYNDIGFETARAFGIDLSFTLDDKAKIVAHPAEQACLNRLLVVNAPIDSFIYQLVQARHTHDPVRAVQVDLDLVYSPNSAQETESNLGKLIERLTQLKVNTVFLQAFADPQGTGNIRQVYFNNRFLPVRADIFAHAVHQIKIRGIKVYAWMPSLSLSLPDVGFNQSQSVRKRGGKVPSSGYQRLSPFSAAVQQRVAGLFADLAMGAQISGVLFQDDAYLSDDEDFFPAALDAFSRHLNRDVSPEDLLPGSALTNEWTGFKTQALTAYIDGLIAAVRRFRPDALFARNLYARLLVQPEAEAWFAQNYNCFLNTYDYVVVMAYPRMEQVSRPAAWLRDLAAAAIKTPSGRCKTIFKLQAYDWRSNQWIDESLLLKQMRAVLAAGVRHLAYYPDNFWEDKPGIKPISLEMSTVSMIEAQ